MGQEVKLIEHTPEVVIISMEDRKSKNTFSEELTTQLVDVFKEVEKNQNWKVVVLTGYDNYFCCGGTKEELLKIQRQDLNFTDLDFFTLPLECKIPVISAMQGHAIGGGLVFGLYSDFSILAKESIYTTNFMKYGFTPGMGATFIVPYRLGDSIGNEMLFSAENYRGDDLLKRGVNLQVVTKHQVFDEALILANTIAKGTHTSILELKANQSFKIKSTLPEIIQKEVRMHEHTFHTPEVRQRIESLFGN